MLGGSSKWSEKMEEKIFRWSEVTVGELGLLSEKYDIEVDGDLQVVKVTKRQSHD